MKIATWNVNSLRVRLPHVLDWLKTEQPDILALQEIKMEDKDFPVEDIEAAGYSVIYSGQKTYNGVAILSRGVCGDVIADIPGLDDHQRRVLCATLDVASGAASPATHTQVRVMNVYIPNGEAVGSDKYRYKLDWLEKLVIYLEEQRAIYPYLILLGDFNIAPEACDVHDPMLWDGRVLCSAPERKMFERFVDLGLCDTFRLFEQAPNQFSWWDYRMAAFRRDLGLRIDHILASPALCAACVSSRIDKIPRAWERPSDHAPVVAVFDL